MRSPGSSLSRVRHKQDRLKAEAEAREIAEVDKKALYTVEARYYIVDGRFCVTAGIVPSKELDMLA